MQSIRMIKLCAVSCPNYQWGTVVWHSVNQGKYHVRISFTWFYIYLINHHSWLYHPRNNVNRAQLEVRKEATQKLNLFALSRPIMGMGPFQYTVPCHGVTHHVYCYLLQSTPVNVSVYDILSDITGLYYLCNKISVLTNLAVTYHWRQWTNLWANFV